MSHLHLLGVELCVAVRAARFWRIVARSAEPVVGVFVFGWSAPLIVVFYLTETWLFFSLRASTEIALKELRSKRASTGKQLLAAAATRFLVIAPLFGLIIFMLTAMIFAAVAVQSSWAEVAEADFLVGLAILAAFLLIEVTAFGQRDFAGTTDREDELREGAMVYRTACMVVLGVPAVLLSGTGYAAEVLVVAVAVASIWVEGAPRHATKVFGMPRAGRSRLFRKARV